jgi:hypothetical protein
MVEEKSADEYGNEALCTDWHGNGVPIGASKYLMQDVVLFVCSQHLVIFTVTTGIGVCFLIVAEVRKG